jgi:splicing factor 3B subunit 1
MEQQKIDPFAKTASTRHITARQSDYHHRRFNCVTNDSADAFQQNGRDVEGGYKDAMRLACLEQEEVGVRCAIEEKERKDREDGKEMMDLDRTPPAAEIKDVARELAMQANREASAKRKRRWDVSEPTDENVDPNQPTSSGEWSKEALDAATLKKRRSRWDATPTNVISSETPKRSRWDQTPASATPDAPMVPIIMNAPGFMHEDKHNHYLTDEELDAVLPPTGYAIVTPPPGYAPMVAPRKLMASPLYTASWRNEWEWKCGDLWRSRCATMPITDSYCDVRSSGVQMYVQ